MNTKHPRLTATLTHFLYEDSGATIALIGWRYLWDNRETVDVLVDNERYIDELIAKPA